jgi:hypothetical protein
MQSIDVITPESDPGTFQVWATGVDASTAVIHGTSQASLWLREAAARRLHQALGEKLGDAARATVQHVPLNPTLIREPTCWSWCGGTSEPHSPDLCYRKRSIVPLTLEPALRGETGMEPATVDLNIEVNDRTPVVGIAVGEDANQHRVLTVVEARQLAASLIDAADMAAGDTAADTAGGAG